MPIRYYGDERDDQIGKEEEKKVEQPAPSSNMPVNNLLNKIGKAIYGPSADFEEMLKGIVNHPFPKNAGDVTRKTATMVAEEMRLANSLVAKSIIELPYFKSYFDMACAAKLPSPPQANLMRRVMVNGPDFNLEVGAYSVEKNGKLVWVFDKSIY